MQEIFIRNQPLEGALPPATVANQIVVAREPRVRRKSSRSAFSATSIASYLGVFLLIVSLVAVSYHPPERKVALANTSQLSATASATSATIGDVDQLLATNVGANLADATDLPVANNVANLSQSLTAESVLSQTGTNNTVAKPQNLQLGADTRSVREYTTVAGDTVPAVAEKYGISAQTVRWANKLTSDALEPGKILTIPPLDGVLYTVKEGDTAESIASKYRADVNILIHDNNLELSGVTPGQQLIIANGDLPETERPGYVAPRRTTVSAGVNYGNYSGGSGYASNLTASVGNRYAWGNCTWYAYERRAQLGAPIGSFWGNASTWAYNARLAGFAVDGNPTPGAIMANGGGYGHVAIVEAVNPGVSVTISEMNAYRFGGGFNRIGRGDIPWGDAVSGYYQYIH